MEVGAIHLGGNPGGGSEAGEQGSSSMWGLEQVEKGGESI